MNVLPELRRLIERVCTPCEVEILKLRAEHRSPAAIAELLKLDERTVCHRLNRADRRVRAEVAAMRGIE